MQTYNATQYRRLRARSPNASTATVLQLARQWAATGKAPKHTRGPVCSVADYAAQCVSAFVQLGWAPNTRAAWRVSYRRARTAQSAKV